MLYGLKASTLVTISALTKVDIPKRAGLNDVFKLARVNGLTCVDHQRAMERKVGPYCLAPRSWGQRLSGALVEGRLGKMYLALKVERRLATVYLARHGSLLKTIREAEIGDALPKREPSPVERRDYSLANIKRISIGGERYRVVPDGLGLNP